MFEYFGNSDIGKKRSTNQDAFRTEMLSEEALLAAVCDGMGGAKAGGVASTLALDVFTEYLRGQLAEMDKDGPMTITGADIMRTMAAAARRANQEVYMKSKSSRTYAGMGTTLAAAVCYDKKIYVVNVGDSRAYLCSSQKIEQITHDHSFVQYLVDIGKMTEAEAKKAPNRNIITKAIGIDPTVEPDVTMVALPKRGKSVLLLCSDGLSGPLDKEELHQILSPAGVPLEEIAERLIGTANEKSGSDNITAVLVRM